MTRALWALWLLSLVVVLLGGCQLPAGDSTPRPRQAEALSLVWHNQYGRDDDPPGILWVTGEELNCTAHGGEPGFRVFTVCALGLTLSGRAVRIAYTEGQPFHTTALTHELVHAYLNREGLPLGDPLHKGAVWDKPGIVEYANGALLTEGM